MANWIREYRFSAGQAGSAGFGINELHINFSVEKSDVSSQTRQKFPFGTFRRRTKRR